MKLAVGIATKGRPAILRETLTELTRQTSPPSTIFICPADAASLGEGLLWQLPLEAKILDTVQGLTAQRNRILEAARGHDIIVFFDDDFFPSPTYLERAVALLATHPEVVIATGVLLADGIFGPGITPDQGRALLEGPISAESRSVVEEYGAYGCNMVVRLAPVYEHRVRFDEQLPLYGWQEDIDFSRQLARHGSVVRAAGLTGVHLGVKGGRTSGFSFGYAQVANPTYLMKKGTLSISFALRLVLKNVAANIARAPFPEPNVDRIGRLKGNVLAFYDLMRMRLHPTRVLVHK